MRPLVLLGFVVLLLLTAVELLPLGLEREWYARPSVLQVLLLVAVLRLAGVGPAMWPGGHPVLLPPSSIKSSLALPGQLGH